MKYLLKLFERLKIYIDKIYYFLLKSSSVEFDNLAAIRDINIVDSKNIYRKALDYALSNDEVSNIAISGPYGSGKSSIIKSYSTYGSKKEKSYLFINLPSFIGGTVDQHKPFRELESSILEQIIYSGSKNLQYSNVKRIRVPSRLKRIIDLTTWTIFFLSLGSIVSIDFDRTVIRAIDNFVRIFEVHYTGFLNFESVVIIVLIFSAILTSIIYVMFSLINKIYSITHLTLSLSKSSLEIETGLGDSLLDKYLDEIYNFFKYNDYSIVVFEDLDRFNNLDVFERLRRINLLINEQVNSQKMRKKVRFVYTISDHIFSDERNQERTKFFDFVLPVLPIIDSSNSETLLKDKIKILNHTFKPSDELREGISCYIKDMRTMINIVNEYCVYYSMLTIKHSQETANELFAMICFKNKHPKEFTKFQQNDGDVFNFIMFLDAKKINILEAIDNKIIAYKEKIQNIGTEELKSKEELDDIFRMFMYRNWPKTNEVLVAKRNDKPVIKIGSKEDILIEPRIYLLMTSEEVLFGKLKYDIDHRTLNGTSLSYEKRLEIINDTMNDAKDKYQKEICELNKEKEDVNDADWSRILVLGLEDSIIQNFCKKYKLLEFVIRKRYLRRNYKKYITYPSSCNEIENADECE